jgi:arsenate reductase
MIRPYHRLAWKDQRMKLLLTVIIAATACRQDATRAPATVVFICEHGAAKSVVASEYFNKLAAERGVSIRAVARGAAPQATMSTAAVNGLREDGLSTSLGEPRGWAPSEGSGAARIVAFDCELPTMKAFKGVGACWNDVPTVADGYAAARDTIRIHVSAMLDQLIAQSGS